MPCYSPIKGYKGSKNSNGKYPIVFNKKYSPMGIPVEVPCGQCIGCRLEYSRQWAVRCMHEAQLHDQNCFITLTYDNEHLPEDGSLKKEHFQKFMKRLRKKYGKVRFYHCGEYGENTNRPHYHACLFGFSFPDQKYWKTHNGQMYFVSKSLEKIWGKGFCTIGAVTFQSAAYVARYMLKKRKGKDAEAHYTRIDPITGEVYYLTPEYTTMSRKPGIAKDWFDKYKNDVYPHDYVVVNGKKVKPPKYYDVQLEIEDLHTHELIKSERKLNAKKHVDNNTPRRLQDREQVQLAKLNHLKRSLENEI
jgi:hypothetical protein